MKFQSMNWKGAAILAAAIGFSASNSFAATLTAKVPFTFQVQNTELPAGDYTVSQLSNNGVPVLLLKNYEARKSAIVLAGHGISESSRSQPRMVFHCGEGGCALSEIWGATSSGGVTVTRPKPQESERATFVYMSRQKAGH